MKRTTPFGVVLLVDDTRLELVTSRTSSGCATSCANRPGGDKRDRTADLLNAIQALSQLSYTPVNKRYYSRNRIECQAFFVRGVIFLDYPSSQVSLSGPFPFLWRRLRNGVPSFLRLRRRSPSMSRSSSLWEGLRELWSAYL